VGRDVRREGRNAEGEPCDDEEDGVLNGVRTSAGAQTVWPQMIAVAEVTAKPMKESSALVAGRPRARPTVGARWGFRGAGEVGKVERDGGPEPIMPISEGKKKAWNCPALG
jgi:hypothetical protein